MRTMIVEFSGLPEYTSEPNFVHEALRYILATHYTQR